MPPLGPALNIGTGVWTAASPAKPVRSQQLHFRNLHGPVMVTFEANGTPHIRASTDEDLFWAIGYVQARFRLVETDAERRLVEGRLAEVIGPLALSSDQSAVMLGLDRAAQLDWQAILAATPWGASIHRRGYRGCAWEEPSSVTVCKRRSSVVDSNHRLRLMVGIDRVDLRCVAKAAPFLASTAGNVSQVDGPARDEPSGVLIL